MSINKILQYLNKNPDGFFSLSSKPKKFKIGRKMYSAVRNALQGGIVVFSDDGQHHFLGDKEKRVWKHTSAH